MFVLTISSILLSVQVPVSSSQNVKQRRNQNPVSKQIKSFILTQSKAYILWVGVFLSVSSVLFNCLFMLQGKKCYVQWINEEIWIDEIMKCHKNNAHCVEDKIQKIFRIWVL